MQHHQTCTDDSSFTQIGPIDDYRDVMQCNSCGAHEMIASATPVAAPTLAVAMDFAALELRAFGALFDSLDLAKEGQDRVGAVNSGVVPRGTPTGRFASGQPQPELQRLPPKFREGTPKFVWPDPATCQHVWMQSPHPRISGRPWCELCGIKRG